MCARLDQILDKIERCQTSEGLQGLAKLVDASLESCDIVERDWKRCMMRIINKMREI